MAIISIQSIATNLLSRRLLQGNNNLEIKCEKAQIISYKDILELYLFFSMTHYWKWIDSEGNSISRQSIFRILYNLTRDILAWPVLYIVKSCLVKRMLTKNYKAGSWQEISSVLFLRTDHWFNIKSGGSVGHLSGVIHGLRSLGLPTHVVSTDRLAGVDNDEYFHLDQPRYELGRNIPNVPELVYNNQLLKFIRKRWHDWPPSFIYQRYSLGNYAGVALKKQYKVPYVCEYNGSFPWMARHWDKKRIFHEGLITQIELLNLHAADVIVVVSRPMKEELLARGINAGKILVNPNGVDPEKYSPHVEDSFLRHKYGLTDKTVIGFIGTFGKWHGAEVLVEAFGLLMQRFPEYRDIARLLMIGDGVTMPEVKECIAKYHIGKSCVLAGRIPQEDGPSHLAACDILASPHVPNPDGTPFFGSPTKLFEYMAMGKGIVASNLNQIGEILKHDKTAWMVKPGDPESLMLGLKKLIDDKLLRERLGGAAREEVVAHYTWKEHTRKIIDKLKEVVG